MRHFGDITKINGANVPVVDVITGGSPCQDLSVAGKRAGLAGERSGLFMEQIRIIKEMRERDTKTGRTGWMVRPRYMVWENVPGAFSSGNPKGADFAAVIEEIIKVAEPTANVCVCVPDGGWTKSGCYYAEDGSWSIAWRVHDAQFWGVPQRRKRISLVADFGGLSAPEILFERKGLSRDIEPCGETGQETPRAVGDSVEGAGVRILNPQDSQGNQIADDSGVYPTLRGCGGAGYQQGYCLDNKAGGGVTGASGTISSQERGGKPGGGKGILIQHEHVGALSTLNNQSVLAYGISSYDSNAMKPPNPHSGIYEADTARTLDLNGGSPACNQGGIAVVQSVGCDVYNQEVTGEVAASLTAASGGTNTSGPKVLCLNDQGGSVMGVSEDVTGALAAEPGMKQQTYVYYTIGTNANASGRNTPLVYEQHSQDARYNPLGEVCETVSAKYGTGGNNQSIVVLPFDTTQITSPQNGNHPHYGDPCHPLAAGAHPPAVAIGNGQLNQISMAEQANTLDTMHDQQAVMVAAGDCRNGTENPDINGTLQAKSNGGVSYNLQNVCRTGAIVRRLTPLECERLQGYPDGWTDIGEWVDSKGKKHKDADSPRYKALGNSIALPFWQWMARRICAQYERPVTMASLFDGIGGFPLVFSRAGAVPVWASEIEEFPIAVTKRHFGNDGIWYAVRFKEA